MCDCPLAMQGAIGGASKASFISVGVFIQQPTEAACVNSLFSTLTSAHPRAGARVRACEFCHAGMKICKTGKAGLTSG